MVVDHPDFEDHPNLMEYESDSENLKYALIRVIYQKGPLDLNQLEEITETDKHSVDTCLRDLEREKMISPAYVDASFRDLEHERITFPSYDDKPSSSGILIGRCVYGLTPLCRSIYSILFDSETR